MLFLIADDHDLFLDGIRSLVSDAFPKAQIKCVSSLDMVYKQLSTTSDFQLVLIDLFMPGMEGTTSIRKLAKIFPKIPIVVVSAEDSPLTIQTCLAAGAAGYVPKSADSTVIIQAIVNVLAGGQFTPPGFRNQHFLSISYRQEEVLICIVEGKSNREISEQLNITEGTVKQYVSGLLKLLNVDNRTRAAAKAKEMLGLASK